MEKGLFIFIALTCMTMMFSPLGAEHEEEISIEKKDPDDDLHFMDMCKRHNFPVEQHIVTT